MSINIMTYEGKITDWSDPVGVLELALFRDKKKLKKYRRRRNP